MNAKTIQAPHRQGANLRGLISLLTGEKTAIIFSIIAVIGEFYGIIADNEKLIAIWALIGFFFIYRADNCKTEKGGVKK